MYVENKSTSTFENNNEQQKKNCLFTCEYEYLNDC